mmetsp:Transcript_4031/g.7926  ORF Transcript_4031/g.7926 Transcript_4031/m.7926 type:complete len:80 (+) Transcript_4031:52-291(+)
MYTARVISSCILEMIFSHRLHYNFRCPRMQTVLMDDNESERPTGSNIIDAFKDLASLSKSGDAVYFHYSGECCYYLNKS